MKYLPGFSIQSDPIWKTVQVTEAVVVVAVTEEVMAAVVEAEGLEETGLAVQGHSSRRLCELEKNMT